MRNTRAAFPPKTDIELTPDEEAELEPVFEALEDWIARVERLAAECTT